MIGVNLVTLSMMSGNGIVRRTCRVDLSDGTSKEFENCRDAAEWSLESTDASQHADIFAKFESLRPAAS